MTLVLRMAKLQDIFPQQVLRTVQQLVNHLSLNPIKPNHNVQKLHLSEKLPTSNTSTDTGSPPLPQTETVRMKESLAYLWLITYDIDATWIYKSDDTVWVVTWQELCWHWQTVHIHRHWRTGHLKDIKMTIKWGESWSEHCHHTLYSCFWI